MLSRIDFQVFTRIALLTKTGDWRLEVMPIIRVTRNQIEAASKAREAALKKDEGCIWWSILVRQTCTDKLDTEIGRTAGRKERWVI